ncbi:MULTISPECIES: hydroxyacid dehydrogenase [unclassified Curtobacterium]|uniref:hydroxyacid dehydrogenase n=1 Tax=unclassified Curtobacterium TaxID=257496 RepID=UPI003A813C2A
MSVLVGIWMSGSVREHVLPPDLHSQLERVSGAAPRILGEDPTDADLQDVEVLLTGWGVPTITPETLDRLPALRAVVHTGGSVRFLTETAWDRDISVSSAADANAQPVAEFTLGSILLAGKEAPWTARAYRNRRVFMDREEVVPDSGNNGRRIGVVGASRIGQRVIDLLRPFDFRVSLYEPYCTQEGADRLGVPLVGDLRELAARSDILTVHAPDLPSTRGMISGDVLAALPDGGVLINTARGALVDQDALTAEILNGRIRALLDVTEPEVLPKKHLLWDLPGAVITPHLAGATGNEMRRLGSAALDDLERFITSTPLAGAVSLHLRQTAA